MNADPSQLALRIDRELDALSERSVAALRKTRRRWSLALRHHPADKVLLAGLELLERYNHRWVAYELVLFHPGAFALVDADLVERLAYHLASWGDVDQFGVLVAGPAWRAGQIGDSLVHQWAKQPDRWWRRAALVATVPLNVRSRGGIGDVSRTLAVCALLLDDRDDMVVKAFVDQVIRTVPAAKRLHAHVGQIAEQHVVEDANRYFVVACGGVVGFVGHCQVAADTQECSLDRRHAAG